MVCLVLHLDFWSLAGSGSSDSTGRVVSFARSVCFVLIWSVRIWIYGWGLAESGSFRDHGLKQEIIALTFCFFFICSTSPPGNQVDGLPPAASVI